MLKLASAWLIFGSVLLAQMPLVTLRGAFKEMDKHSITIESEGETVVLRRTKKTRFLRNNKPVGAEVARGTELLIEVEKDLAASIVAVNVYLDPPKPTQ